MIAELFRYFGMSRLPELGELQCQRGWQNKQLQKLALERDSWQTRAGEMVDDLNEAEKQCESLTTERDDARAMVENLTARLAETHSQLKQFESCLHDRSVQIATLTEKVDKYRELICQANQIN